MASLSTGSVSGSSSLGNTSLRGFGGMATGIDRDAIIEQMTLGTNTKISNQQSAITKLEWKQEAFRGISDKILDLYDNYSSYTAGLNLKDPGAFAKNIISVHAKDSISKFVTATGTSALVDNVSIRAVKQLATSTVRQSDSITDGKLQTTLDDLNATGMNTSHLLGAELKFGVFSGDDKGWESQVSVTLGNTYKETDGDSTKTVNFTDLYIEKENETVEEKKERLTKLAEALNKNFSDQNVKFGSEDKAPKLGEDIKLKYDADHDKMTFVKVGKGSDGQETETEISSDNINGYTIRSTSSALKGLGFDKTGSEESITFNEYNTKTEKFSDAYLTKTSALNYLTGKKVTFNYDGSKKDIELITAEEKEKLAAITQSGVTDATKKEQLEAMAANIQKRLNQAFGTMTETADGKVTGGVKVSVVEDGGLAFSTKADSSVSITSGEEMVMANLGIASGESNKVNLSGKLSQSALGINLNEKVKNEDGTESDKTILEEGLVINGVKIGGIDANTSISDILSKINNSQAGVNATYVSTTGQFMLVSKETGAGREINLDSTLAQKLFGATDENGVFADGKNVEYGKNAVVEVSYGNGVNVQMERASNTFDLEGLSVTVSGTFGGEWVEEAGNTEKVWKYDSSETVSFSAKADVEKVTEQVKKFFEDFNALVTEVNTQVTTRPDSAYGPLTDEQKNEMNETSIENWEKKAKSGLLFNDSTMRELSMDIQSIFSKMMMNGASYDDLKKIGITYSDDYKDGGKLVFDESAFKSAMESDPDLVSNIFTGGGGVSKGLMKTVEDTFTPYATRFASRNQVGNSRGSYGRLIEEAGSEKIPTSILNNQIYKEIKTKQDLIEQLRSKLQTEQDRYISMFTTMETMINQMNSQSSWLSQLG